MMKCEMEKERHSDLVQIKELEYQRTTRGQCSQGRRKRRIVKNRRTDEREEEAKACVYCAREL